MRLTSHELGVAGCGLRVAGCGLRVAGRGLRVTGYGLRFAADLSQCTGCYYTYLNGITFSAKVVHVTQRHGIILVNRKQMIMRVQISNWRRTGLIGAEFIFHFLPNPIVQQILVYQSALLYITV